MPEEYMGKYIEEEGLRFVWIEPTIFTRAGKKFKREGHYRVIGPVEYVPNGRRRELSEEHKRKIRDSLLRAPNGRRKLGERSSRYEGLSAYEKEKYRKQWEEKGIEY